MLRAWRSCSSTSSRRHPDALEGAGVDDIFSGEPSHARHTAHALPDKFDVVCSRHLNEQRSSYPTSWASLGQLGGLPRQAFGVDATRGLQASYTRLGAVAAAGLPRFRFDAADWLRGQATADRAYAFACAYDRLCVFS